VWALGFAEQAAQAGGYTPLARGSARIALNRRSDLDEHHPIRRAAAERPGQGVEIVLETGASRRDSNGGRR